MLIPEMVGLTITESPQSTTKCGRLGHILQIKLQHETINQWIWYTLKYTSGCATWKY